MPENARFATRAVHAGLQPDPSFGSIVPAIHQASTFVQRAPGEFVEDFDYSRSANPTRAALERALGELEGGHASAFSSGMAAEHALITAIARAGAHVVLPDDLYGGTYRLVDKVLTRWGLSYDMVDQQDLDAVERAVRPDTALVWVETPTNPALACIDLAGVIERKRDALVVVDNTFATPVHQRPLELGADAVVHSTTKYLGGHSDTIGGAAIVRDAELHERVRFVQNSIGAVPGPLDCFLVHRGLRTLHLRVAAHDANGLAVSSWLHEVAGIADVRWPGFGGMVCFRHPDAVRIASSTRIFSLAESLGGVESLIEVPQAMTHQSVEGSSAAVPADLVRLSCGVEAGEDLIADLAQAIGVPVAAPAQASLHT
ncbi:MAG: PLP-dependent transferase [Solirubrobacterales bacterium]|nr:PLP-dependent transferase [Solirubrobacterales bacterium]